MKDNHAIIGCGRIAPNHVDAFWHNDRKISIVCDIDVDVAKELASRYSIPSISTDFRSVLSEPSIKSVSICTPHHLHALMTIAALKAGKHVIVEKPMALSLTDGRAMLQTANQTGKVLSVISQHRYDPISQAVARIIADDGIGDLALITGTLQCSKDNDYYSGWRGRLRTEGGSTLANQAIHTLDQMLVMGGSATVVHAIEGQTKFAGVIETEDTLVASLRFDSGALGVLSSTNSSTIEWKSGIEIVGTTGSIGFTTGFPVRLTNVKMNDEELADSLRSLELLRETAPVSKSYYGVSHRAQVQDFIAAIDGNHPMQFTSGDAYETLKTMSSIYGLSRGLSQTI